MVEREGGGRERGEKGKREGGKDWRKGKREGGKDWGKGKREEKRVKRERGGEKVEETIGERKGELAGM